MADSSYRCQFPAGHVVFSEGDTSTELYMLISGSVEILMKDQVIAIVKEGGAVLGEVSFLLGSPRTATVCTVEPSEFLVIVDVQALIDTQPLLLARIAKILAQRLKEMDEKFVTLRRALMGN